ncbi:MAG: hypothetical protein R3B84_04060 [Zavarzinella sp.]
MARWLLSCMAILLLSNTLFSQIIFVPGQRTRYQPCKIVNNFGTSIRIKLVGFDSKDVYMVDIPQNREFVTPQGNWIAEGERIVGVWDYPGGKLYLTGAVVINGPTLIVIEGNPRLRTGRITAGPLR